MENLNMDSRQINDIYKPLTEGGPDGSSNWKDIKDSVERHIANKKRVDDEQEVQISEDSPPIME